MNNLIGRQAEIAELRRIEESGKAEFVALYGRRRVGKTFLVQRMYRNEFCFSMSGSIDGSCKDQLQFFHSALVDYGYEGKMPKNWIQAFDCLRTLLEQCDKQHRMIVFIDELPCLDTPRSGFVEALEHFWNSWASLHDNMMLIVCGSATSWMVKNILDNRGGLHNRVTHEIHLSPFTLKETEEYLVENGMDWDRASVVQAYMTFGGVAYYLSLLNPSLSLAQNIDRLFFYPNGELRREYPRLYRSLFRNPEPYTKVIECLMENKKGLTRTEIVSKLKAISSGKLSGILDDLQYCDFIRYYNIRKKKIQQKDGLYQLTDFFTIFFLTFCRQPSTNPNFWTNNLLSARLNNWYGLAFERVCKAHIPQIKKALGIDRIQTEYYSWYSDATEGERSQIDLLIERADKLINLCEIKYCSEFYTMTKDEHDRILRRVSMFRAATECKRGIVPVLITTYGLNGGKHSGVVKDVVTMDALFAE